MGKEKIFNYSLKAVLNDDKECLLSDYTQGIIMGVASGSSRFVSTFSFKKDDVVTIKINDMAIFTGFVEKSLLFNEMYDVVIKEGTRDFHEKSIQLSYRKEKVKNILKEILDECGITDFKDDFTDVELERFHLNNVEPHYALQVLAETILQYTGEDIIQYFDEDGIFYFVSKSSYVQSEVKSYKSGEDIIELTSKMLVTFPENVRANNTIKINDEEFDVSMSVINFSDGTGRMKLYYESR